MSVAQRFFFSRGVSADLYRQSVIRTGSYFALSVIFALRAAWGAIDYEPVYALAVSFTLLMLGIVGLVLSSAKRSSTVQYAALFALPIIDVLLVTALIMASGGLQSRLVFMYAVPSLASVAVSMSFAVAMGGMIVAAYSAAVLGGYQGVVPVMEKTVVSQEQLLVSHILRTILFEIVVLGGCVVYIAYLMRRHWQELDTRDEIIYGLVERMREPLSPQEADAVLAALAIPTLPIERRYNFGGTIPCGACGQPIRFLNSYWGVAPRERRAYPFGEYRNDAHCSDCHIDRPHQCPHCAAWGGAVSDAPFVEQQA